MDAQAICAALEEAAGRFGVATVTPAAGDLRFGPLYADLTGDVAGDPYPLALECVYEGYLLHYRTSRVTPPETALETRLLAGDHFDARGLYEVAAREDLDAVELLERLMTACSWLRSEGLPYEWDDDLWVLAVAGIASLRGGGNAVAALTAFAEVDRLIVRDRARRIPEVVRRGAAAIRLRDDRPLRAALGLDPPAGETLPSDADPLAVPCEPDGKDA